MQPSKTKQNINYSMGLDLNTHDDGIDIIEEQIPEETCVTKTRGCCSKIFTCKNVTTGLRYCGFFVMGMGAQSLIHDITNYVFYKTLTFYSSSSLLSLGSTIAVMGQKFRPDQDE